MKRIIFFFIFIFTLLFFSPSHLSAAITCGNGEGGTTRCAECDRCGYCNNQTAPGNWAQCKACLYPQPKDAKAPENETLKIILNSSGLMEQVTPAAGKYYTQLGCIDTGMSSFTDPSAAGGVLNFMLTRVIFPTVGVLAFMSLIYGAFLLITAESRPEQIAKGRSYIVGAIVGLIFTLSVVLIINIIGGDILKIPGFSTGSQLKIMAASQYAQSPDGVRTNPRVEVSFNDKLINTFDMTSDNKEVKTYSVNLPTELPATNIVKVRFTNDHWPNGTNPTQDATKEIGDRNVFIQKITLKDKDCVPSIYFKEQSKQTLSVNYPVNMFWQGYMLCSIN